METDNSNQPFVPNLGYRDGMGDDEELQIGGVVAGMKTENNKIVENS
jgi:hypothetical protein